MQLSFLQDVTVHYARCMLEGEEGEESHRNFKKQGMHTKFYTIWENAGTNYACKTLELIAAQRKELLMKNGLCERTLQLDTSAE